MADELIDICDDQNNLTGETVMKSIAHAKGLFHRSTHVWIYNSKGEMLLQLRAKEKKICPEVWTMGAAGHIRAGVKPKDAAVEEIKEELGIDISKEDLDFLWIKYESKLYKEYIENEFGYAHLLKLEHLPTNLQKDEVEEIKFIHIDDLKNDLLSNPENYIGKKDYWFEIIEEIKKRV